MKFDLLRACVRLYDHYESLMPVNHYYGLLAIYGLCRTAEAAGDEALLDRCRTILRPFVEGKVKHNTNFEMYWIGGIPAAYMLMRGYMPEIKGTVAQAAEDLMRKAPRDRRGIFCHPRYPGQGRIWIDVCMAVTPFLLFAGLALDRAEYIEEAAAQTLMMIDELLDRDCGLLHQCKNFGGPGVLSEDHWGRGNGWGLLGLTELIQYLPGASPRRREVEARFRELTRALLVHQAPSGMWRQEIPDPTSYEESSATGLIAYGLGVGLRCGVLGEDARPHFRKALEGLAACVGDDGSIHHVCIGCLYPGGIEAYKAREKRTDDPHGFGPAILAFSEAARHGIREVEPAALQAG